jgi:hypothetical protein
MCREIFNVWATVCVSSPPLLCSPAHPRSTLLLTLIMVRFTFLALSALCVMTSAFPTDSNDYSEYVSRAHRLVPAIHLFSTHGGKCYRQGEMKCVGNDFATCDHGYFVIRRCAKGTACREHVSNGIFPIQICTRLTMCRPGREGCV